MTPLRALTIVNFSYLARTKYEFMSDVAKKIVAFYTFSVRPTTLEFENLRIGVKRFDEEEKTLRRRVFQL